MNTSTNSVLAVTSVNVDQYNQLNLAELGLMPEDYEKVLEASRDLDASNGVTVAEYGKNIAVKTASYTDDLLNLVKNKNLDETGQKLNQVVRVAQSLNTNSVLSPTKTTGFFGSIITKFRGMKTSFNENFNSTKEQIDALLLEVETSQGGLKKRIDTLGLMFNGVQDEYKQLGVYVAAGKLKAQDIQAEIAELTAKDQDQLTTQKIYELNHVANNLDKRISDLTILQQSALQTLPMIRIIQSNNAMLVDKFYAIKNITLPAWKNQISLAISLQEQKNSVQLANSIDDATNDLLKRNADLLHQNSVDTAKANQRSVIDIETLEHVQNTLIKSVNDVIQIQKEGQKKRGEAEIRLKELQNTFHKNVLSQVTE